MSFVSRWLSRAWLLVFASSVFGAYAQSYPTRPVTVIAPFAAGGPTDTIARVFAERMSKALGQSVIVENATGAAGVIGVGKVVRATPDGYTIGIGNWSSHVVNGAVYDLPYDLARDLEPIGLLVSNPQVIISNIDASAKNLDELIAWIRRSENDVFAGTAGVGSASHVSEAYFFDRIGAKAQFVPYQGTAPAMQDLMAGRITLLFEQAATALPYIRSRKVRAYAVTAGERLASAPDIPTVDEAGLPGFHVAVWHALWAPKGTPPAIVARLNSAIAESLADPAMRKRLADLSQQIPSVEERTPAALRAYQRAEIDKWWPLVKAAGIKAQTH